MVLNIYRHYSNKELSSQTIIIINRKKTRKSFVKNTELFQGFNYLNSAGEKLRHPGSDDKFHLSSSFPVLEDQESSRVETSIECCLSDKTNGVSVRKLNGMKRSLSKPYRGREKSFCYIC